MAPTAFLLTIGDELLAGDILDRNGATMARSLRKAGIQVVRHETVPDDLPAIVAALDRARAFSLCLVSGGLGPTTDDLTAESIAAAAGVELERVPEVVSALRDRFAPYLARFERKHGAEAATALIEQNLKQADLPAGATVLANPIGTAVGFAVELARPESGESGECCWVASMPGVPSELKKMLAEQVIPRLADRFALVPIPRRVFRILGDGESAVQQRIAPALALVDEDPAFAGVVVHYRAHTPEILITFEARTPDDGRDPSTAGQAGATEETLARLDEPMRAALGASFYGLGDDDLAVRVVERLRASGLTLATAESCTGGGVGDAVTAIPGSSACFLGGVIAYANEIKAGLLGVPPATLVEHGAVSEPVAMAMARGACAALGSDLGVGITGLAGPGGGSAEKPVGTVHIAVCRTVCTANGAHAPDGSTEPKIVHRRLSLHGNRGTVRRSAVVWALGMVHEMLADETRSH